ncbi:phosphatidylinositol transfer protein 3-like [Cucurbita pepo subsp. pepo]|uniref:phosphatidylinositol transfer protein 3-like n=1 Tax=Cucurbita pepo subsp. pepo TaxID=3664 RepID=UPI000C9D639B|nr:phosphatidylinositol transfer protein 3-like [Cucurbita pepo subsp. pepo]XP_023523580.1 phosphatidylinositol transfer protein 3-like [Cucurbita pepo subsp. pepo]
MCSNLEVPSSIGCEKAILTEEQHMKISEVRRLLGPLSGKSSIYCSDPSISRYLRARNWNVKKATKMLKASLKWRSEYKPEEIQWDEVAHEAETGKLYCANYNDRHGRTVIVMRPCRQVPFVLCNPNRDLLNIFFILKFVFLVVILERIREEKRCS